MQEVEAALDGSELGNNLIGEDTRTTETGETDTIQTLAYSRLVCVAWGVCGKQSQDLKQLNQRLTELEKDVWSEYLQMESIEQNNQEATKPQRH